MRYASVGRRDRLFGAMSVLSGLRHEAGLASRRIIGFPYRLQKLTLRRVFPDWQRGAFSAFHLLLGRKADVFVAV